MADSSFDVVAEVDRQEVDNALNQASKELAQRYDFKGTNASISWSGDQVIIQANSEERVNAALDVFKTRLIKRKVSQKALDVGEIKPASGDTQRVEIGLVAGIPKDKAKKMVKAIKDAKLKVTAAVQDDQLRVSSKSRDALQEAQQILRENDQDLPITFTNYR